MANIWAHTMVKNEAKWLWYSVSSVVNFVDKILLWDTGSTDGSIKIEKELKKKYPNKILLNNVQIKKIEDFTKIRQVMLDATKSEWFLMVDGDEIWWQNSIQNLVSEIDNINNNVESIVVPTINLVGDVYHFQDESSGNYNFGNLKGHYNLRAVKTSIPGLHSQGIHGTWGWADDKNNMIQDRNTYKFVNAPYLHATNIERSVSDQKVFKRSKKLKHELGVNFPLDQFYPEVFFEEKPDFIQSPWKVMSGNFWTRSVLETPIRKLKRKLITGKVGY